MNIYGQIKSSCIGVGSVFLSDHVQCPIIPICMEAFTCMYINC